MSSQYLKPNLLSTKEDSSSTSSVLVILTALTIFLGVVLFPTYHFMMNEQSTNGRVVEWFDSEAQIRYSIPNQDSMDVRVKYVYIRDQKAIKNADHFTVFYNSKRPCVIDVSVARKYTFPLPMTIVFLISFYATATGFWERFIRK